MKKNKLFLTAIITSLLFASCDNISAGLDENTIETNESKKSENVTLIEGYGNVSGFLRIDGALPEAYVNVLGSEEVLNEENEEGAGERAAYPSKPDITSTDFIKEIVAVNQNNTSDTPIPADFDITTGAFTISNLQLGIPYKIVATVKEVKDSNTIIILKGESEEFTLTPTNSVKPDIRIELYALTSETGIGAVRLEARINNSGIKKAAVTVISNTERWQEQGAPLTYLTDVDSFGISPIIYTGVNSTAVSVPSGSYDVKIDFLSQNVNAVPLFSTTQRINVFDGLVTNRWSGKDECIQTVGSDTVLYLYVDGLLCDKFNKVTDFYIDGINGRDYNTGTWAKPLQTIGAAFQKMNDSNADYTINITSNITVPTSISYNQEGSLLANSVIIRGFTNDIKLDANGMGTVISFDTLSNVKITIENLTITGGNAEDGGGVVITGSSNIEFGRGAVITQNKARSSGAGVYINGVDENNHPTLSIKSGAVISDNHNSHALGNVSIDTYGLGICAERYAEVIMSGGEIYGNSSAVVDGNMGHVKGGGVYVCRNAKFQMSDGKIYDNEVTRVSTSSNANGGAVYVACNTTGNSNTNEYGKFIMSEKAYIPYGVTSGSSLVKGAGKNDIYLDGTAAGETANITINSALVAPEGCADGVQAVITPPVYSPKNIVLTGANENTLKGIAQAKQIIIADQNKNGDLIEWIISTSGNGKMQLAHPLLKMYVKADGNNDNSGKSADKAFSNINKCWEVISEQEVADGEYEIYIVGSISGKQEIPLSIAEYSINVKKDVTAKSILISGASDLNSSGLPQDTINGNVGSTAVANGSAITIKTDVPVTFQKINITGGNTTTNGGGLNISSSSNVTIDSNVRITSNHAKKKGGGIYNSGTLTVKGGKIITNYIDDPESIDGGAGIYNSAVVYISGGEISDNNACASTQYGCGGGIFNKGSVFIYGSPVIGSSGKANVANAGGGIYNGGYLYIGYSSANSNKTPNKTESGTPKIQYNMATNGAGIYTTTNGYVYMRGGEISNNSARNSTNCGMGVYNAGNFIMTGGKISNNAITSASGKGAGVFIPSGTFDMQGGTISDNYVSGSGGQGGAIYNNGIFKMSGGAYIPNGAKVGNATTATTGAGYNDVYLNGTKTVIVGNINITGNSGATITLPSWSRGTVFLSADGETTLTEAKANRFGFTNTDTWTKELSTDNTTASINSPIYISASGTNNAIGTLENPVSTIAYAENIIKTTNNSALEYEVIIVGKVSAGTFTSALDGKAAKIKLHGKTGSGSDSIEGTGTASSGNIALQIQTSIPFVITDLKITGANNTDSSNTYAGGLKIRNGSDVTLSDGVLITGNYGVYGGGVYNAGTLIITGSGSADSNRCVITDNHATKGSSGHMGGGIYNSGTLKIKGYAKISGNTAPSGGGAIYNAGTLEMQGSFEIPAGNDNSNIIYLTDTDSRAIKITNTVTGTAPVAKIKTGSTTQGRVLFIKGNDADINTLTFSASVSKFELVNSGYSINSDSSSSTATLQEGVVVSTSAQLANVISNLTEDGAKIVLTGSSTIDTSCLASASYKIKLDVTNYEGGLAAIQKPNIQEIIINSSQIGSAYVFRNQAGTAVCSDLRTVHIKGTDTTTAYGMSQANLFQGCTSLRNIYFDEGVQNVCIGWGFMNNYIQNTVSIHIPSTATNILINNATNNQGNASDFNKIYGLYYKGTKDALKNITVTAKYPNNNNNDQITVYYNDSSSFLIYWKKGENAATGTWIED